ncbi:MAG TPA: DUF1080 domain-containing protein [Acidobacteriota bacterium]|nr:DUF1080 domain-containing protein [Acidobacteriota bacterium]
MPVARLLIIGLFVLGWTAFTPAQEAWVDLFDGKTLEGWVNVNCGPETWSVRDGMIVCTGKPTGVLRTEKQYQNYILELEWRHMEEGGNAGLFVHSDPITARGQPFTRSIEIQILDGNHGDIFSIHGARLTPVIPHPRGWNRALPTEKRARPDGEWNHYRVESRDGVITLAVNGQVVNQAVNAVPRKGYICLESEGSEIHFRNIRIRELPSHPAPDPVTARMAENHKILYNGLDLRGWQSSAEPPAWTADDWILKPVTTEGEDRASRTLWTVSEYKNFNLIVDWRQVSDSVGRQMQHILPDGTPAKNADGSPLMVTVRDAGQSAIFLRGSEKASVQIWSHPIGSGGIEGYRSASNQESATRMAVTPMLKADQDHGEWNRFEIVVEGQRVTVLLNDTVVVRNALLRDLPLQGPIGLQFPEGQIEFANIYILEKP